MNKKNRTFMMALCMAVIFSNTFLAIESGGRIDKEFRVESDGAELFIKVRGQNIKKPVVLYLHGGPGEANGPLLFQAYAGPLLEEHFVVGYLHQRNTCMSPEAPIRTLTIQQYVEDVDAIVEFLKKIFQKDKIFLVGHSFGGALGYLYLLEHEENINKFVSAGGAFSAASIEKNGYQAAMELSKKANNQEAVKKLKELGPPPYETFQRGMVWRMLGMRVLEEMNEGISRNLEMSKVMSVTGIESIDPQWQEKSLVIANTMWNELSTINLEDKVQKISTPLLLISGAKDILVPFQILKNGFDNYGGEKEHFILKKSNHMMFIDEPDLFVLKVIEFFEK